MSDLIHFEHPLNERIRTFLRLEHLFLHVDHFRPLADSWSNRAAIDGLLSIITVFGRSDLKTEILKELERHTASLERVRQQPGVDMQALGQVLDDLEQAIHQVYRMDGQIARKLRNNEFLTTILQRSSIPGGGCNFDLPQYHFWLNQPHEIRVGLPRNTATFTEISGNKHRFSIRFLEVLDTGKPVQTTSDIDFQLTACIF